MKAFILAAGKGTRMQSELPKSLHIVGDKPIVFHTIQKLSSISLIDEIFVIIGHQGDLVKRVISKEFPEVKFIFQQDLNGTGQAVLEILNNNALKSDEDFMVMNADDSLFYEKSDILKILDLHIRKRYFASLFIVKDNLDRKYRKVILDKDKKFKRFTKKPSKIGYTLTGFYIFNKAFIQDFLSSQAPAASEELKLTDFLYLKEFKKTFNCYIIEENSWFGINTQEELKLANNLWLNLK